MASVRAKTDPIGFFMMSLFSMLMIVRRKKAQRAREIECQPVYQ